MWTRQCESPVAIRPVFRLEKNVTADAELFINACREKIIHTKKKSATGGRDGGARGRGGGAGCRGEGKSMYLWDTFSKQVIFVAGRDITFE